MSKKEDADIVAEARTRIQEAYDADRKNREEAAIDLAMLAGRDHWTAEAQQARRNRPMLTINRLPQFVRQVTNSIRQSDLSIKANPVDSGPDTLMAKIYNGLLKQIQYRSSAEHVYATAVEQQAACGIGYFRILTEYADDGFDQEIRIKRIPNPLSVYCDPSAVEPDRSDARWFVVTEMIPRKGFEDRYPGADAVEIDAPSDSRIGMFWATTDSIRVAEYWRKVPMKRRIAQLATGEVIDITKMGEAAAGTLQIKRTREVDGWKVEQFMISGAQVLSRSEWAGKHIPIVPVIGAEIPIDNGIYRHGVVRFAREPQQLYNYHMSAAAETSALAPKAPYLATPAQIGPHKALWDAANNSARPYLLYEPDPQAPGAMPQRQMPPQPPVALLEMANIAAEDMKATTGIYDAGLGARSNETSGRAIIAREQQGDTANFHFADNFKRSLEHAGRILLDLIPKIYDNERAIRIAGDNAGEEDQTVPINVVVHELDGTPVVYNDLSAAKFDIQVTVGPNFASKRQEAAAAMMEFLRMYPDAAPVVSDLLVKQMDWPGADEIAKRLKSMVPPQVLQDPDAPPPPPPNPLDDPVIEADVSLKIAQSRKAHADASKIELETTAMSMGLPLGQPQPLPDPAMMMGQPPQNAPSMPPMDGPPMGPPQGEMPLGPIEPDMMPADPQFVPALNDPATASVT